MYLNKAIVFGNLTRDPELRALPSGNKVANFSIATNRVWKDKDGNKQEDTEFHNIVVFGRQAETTAQYLKKGSSALIEGRIQTRSWEAQDGSGKKYRTEIVADRVQFGPRTGPSTGSGQAAQKNDSDQSGGKDDFLETIEYPQEDINSEDIPF